MLTKLGTAEGTDRLMGVLETLPGLSTELFDVVNRCVGTLINEAEQVHPVIEGSYKHSDNSFLWGFRITDKAIIRE